MEHLLAPRFSFSTFASRRCVSLVILFITCILLALNPCLLPCVGLASEVPLEGVTPAVKCMLGNETTCPAHHCCVKRVVTYRDESKEPLVGTECQPLLPEGAMCLKNPEDYLCPCLPGMKCDIARFDTMGHCKPQARVL